MSSCADHPHSGASCQVRCECVWVCGRGATRLSCELRNGEEGVEIEVRRNNRLYGSYRFLEKMAALTFATRLRRTFEGNGWVPTQAG